MSDDVVALLASGEGSGRLDAVVSDLAESHALRARRQREVRSALVYPSFLMLAMFFALLLLSLYLAPALQPIFSDAGRPVPLVLRALVGFDEFVSVFGVAILALAAAGGAGLALAARSRGGRARLAEAMQRLPVVSGALGAAANARYLKTMALLIGNGVPLLEAMRLGAETSTSASRRSGLLAARQRVSEGAPFWHAIEESGLFAAAVISLVRLGEQSNNLAPMLARAGATVDVQLQRRLERGVTLLTPALTLLMGVVVGGLVISVLSTLLSVNEIAIR
jgi:general secretion pathway protein F